jgi:hypothetical protein
MKTVFNNRQLAHVWAQQTQSRGRNANNSMYFNDNKIWSYGSHYCIASINYNSKDERLNLINEHGYSSTTSKQRRDVLNSLNYKGLYVPRPSDINHPDNEDYLFNQLIETISESLNEKKKYKTYEDFKRPLANLNEFLAFIGKPKIDVPMDIIELLIDVHSVRAIKLRAYEEKRAEKRKLAEIAYETARLERIQEYADQLRLWPQGLNTRSIPNDLFPKDYSMIRIKPNSLDTVETSRGAEVPLNEALELLKSTLDKSVNVGYKVGHFKVDEIKNDILEIGCHTISISQAYDVLKPLLKEES